MRFAIIVDVPVEVGNTFEKDPKAAEFFAQILEQIKPEAGYFSASRRWLLLVVKAETHEELTKMVLPVWHLFKTYPQVEPVASLEEWKVYLPKLSELVKGL